MRLGGFEHQLRSDRTHSECVGFIKIRRQSVEVNVLNALGRAAAVLETDEVITDVVFTLEAQFGFGRWFLTDA